MENIKTIAKNGRLIWLVLLIAMVGASCAPKLSLQVVKPAEIDTSGIRNVAIGSFELIHVDRIYHIERNGQWQSHKSKLSEAQKKALANQIRARVINLLSATPYFQLNYTDEFQKLETLRDFQFHRISPQKNAGSSNGVRCRSA